MAQGNISDLHKLLEHAAPAKGREEEIVLYDRFSKIKEHAQQWLRKHGKNGREHSKRLEKYLGALTEKLREKDLLSHAEVFVLLCAAYMHDLGYRYEGRLKREGHEKRSHDLLINDPKKYHLDDFPRFGDGYRYPRAAEAIGWVCYGHAHDMELPLSNIPHEFADQAFQQSTLNLRKLSALLRVADEADDPYLRPPESSMHSIRSQTPLVEVGKGKIVWYWDRYGTGDSGQFEDLLEKKKQILGSSLEYLNEIRAGDWDLVLHPQARTVASFMAVEPVETFVGRESDLEELHRKIRERGEGAITGVVGTGGIGKTELARMYAKRYKADYPAGIFWASLRGSTWREEARKILGALYVGGEITPFPDDARAKEEICKRLNRRGTLLVIDNVKEADEIIKPGCSILVTTRERGAFGMMHRRAIHELSRLSENEGKSLLMEILGEPRVARDPVGASRIVEILGGMPLALEIAAYHLEAAPDLSFPNYIGEIQGKIEELKIGDVEDKNVMASLELSLKQLETSESGAKRVALFEAASVCAESGFTSITLAEAGGLRDMDRRALGQLAGELHKRSLLEFDQDSGRYSMHPLLRQLSETRLRRDENRERSYREIHCTYFLRFAEANNNSPEAIRSEKDGIWQAMVQAIQIGRAEELLPRFLDHLTRPFRQLVARKEFEMAFRYLVETNLINIDELGMTKDLASILQVFIEHQAALQDLYIGWICSSLGLAYANLGEYRKAIELHEKALEIARRIGDVLSEGNNLGNMGVAYRHLGEYRKAIELHEKALEIARRIGDVRGEGSALGNMGLAYTETGMKRKALECFEAGRAIFERLGLLHMVARIDEMMKSAGF
jgi:tetratricopeptide (TPR) repeat protein